MDASENFIVSSAGLHQPAAGRGQIFSGINSLATHCQTETGLTLTRVKASIFWLGFRKPSITGGWKNERSLKDPVNARLLERRKKSTRCLFDLESVFQKIVDYWREARCPEGLKRALLLILILLGLRLIVNTPPRRWPACDRGRIRFGWDIVHERPFLL